MKTFELKDLCGYLPHRLEVIHERQIKEVHGIMNEEVYLDYNEIGTDMSGKELCEVIPCFLPLSALTEPLPDGSIPIVEIGAMLGLNNLTACDVDGKIEYGWNEQLCDDYQGYSFGWSDKLKTFAVWYDCIDGNPIDTMCSLDAIEYLYANHFWLGDQSYFEQGLIIDKRTVKS